MTLNQLKYLFTIYQCGSMNKASQILYVSQPTISVAIKELEKELGVTLITRDHNRIRFTEIGIKAAEESEKILRIVDDLKQAARDISDKFIEIRVGFSPAMSKQIVPLLISHMPEFERKYPNVKVNMIECAYNKQFEALEGHKTTLAFGKSIRGSTKKFCYIPLIESPVCLCIGPKHRFASRKSVRLSEIMDENILTFLKEDSKTNESIVEWAKSLGYNIRLKYYSQSSVVEELIRQGMGVSLLVPKIYINNPDILCIELEDTIKLDYGIFHLRERTLSTEEKLFIDQIKCALQNC